MINFLKHLVAVGFGKCLKKQVEDFFRDFRSKFISVAHFKQPEMAKVLYRL